MPGASNSSVTAGDVAATAAAIVTAPLWIWIPIGSAVANVFCQKPPKDVSPVLLRYVKQLHSERCFAKPFNKYFHEKLADIRATMKGYEHMAYNIALCGEARVGKSSLCNALLGLRDLDRGAAQVGVVECTMVPTVFHSPATLPHLYVWDMPGAGTQRHSSHDYYNSKFLYACDGLLLVTRDTILEVDGHIIKQAQLAGQKVAIVRTHAEPQIKGLMRSRGMSAEAAAYTLKRSMFDNMVEELRRYGASADVDIFFVDRWAFCEENFYQENGIRLGSSDGLLDEPKLLMWLAGLERERSK